MRVSTETHALLIRLARERHLTVDELIMLMLNRLTK